MTGPDTGDRGLPHSIAPEQGRPEAPYDGRPVHRVDTSGDLNRLDPSLGRRRPKGRRRKESGVAAARRRGGEEVMVPDAKFASYYGRNIVKPAPWGHEIPTYLFLGGLAAGSALVAAGGEMTGRRELQRNGRLVALGALGGSTIALVSDLGKPSRFYNMMRTVKLTSPMSVGSWILAGFGAFTGVAAFSEVMKEVLPNEGRDLPMAWFWPYGDRLASIGAGFFSAPLAAYTAVLLSDTATPTWHAAYRELPFVFVGSALAAAGGAAMATTGTAETAPARRMAIGGALLESAAMALLERQIGVPGETLHEGRAGRLLTAAKALTAGGAALTLVAGRWRPAAALAGAALLAGSAATRFGVFEAGIESAKDPRYTVIPQKQRLAARRAQAALDAVSDATGLPTAAALAREAHHDPHGSTTKGQA
jgi:hypothetical protein